MTNEEKRNIYNNIQNLYNMDFTTWQEVLAQLYNLVADIDQKFDVVKEKFELMLGKEVANKLEEMYNDGSLEKLLNTQTLERIKQELLQIITTNKTEFNNFKNEINEQLDTIVPKAYNTFLERLLKRDIKKIKLIGDSITEGVGANGHTVPKDARVILTMSNGIVKREGDFDCNCWANLFRRYIQNYDDSVDFFNAGIGGWSTVEALQYKEQWVSNDEDVLFVMLGTNDRTKTLEGYKTRITEFLEYCNSRCNTLIVMCPPPATTDYNSAGKVNYNFTTNDINKVLQEICIREKYTFISNYQDFLDFCYYSNTDSTLLLQSDGSHPHNAGYEVMWHIIQKNLNIIDNANDWYKIDQMRTSLVKQETHLNNIPDVSIDRFLVGTNIWITTPGKASEWGMPFSKAGILVTYKPSISESYDKYAIQSYYVLSNGKYYTRGLNSTTKEWNEWNEYALASTSVGTKPSYVVSTRDSIISTDLPSKFKNNNNVERCIITSTTKVGYPENKAGTLEVCSIGGDVLVKYVYQTYWLYGENIQYRRYALTDDTWGDWIKICQPVI